MQISDFVRQFLSTLHSSTVQNVILNWRCASSLWVNCYTLRTMRV